MFKLNKQFKNFLKFLLFGRVASLYEKTLVKGKKPGSFFQKFSFNQLIVINFDQSCYLWILKMVYDCHINSWRYYGVIQNFNKKIPSC